MHLPSADLSTVVKCMGTSLPIFARPNTRAQSWAVLPSCTVTAVSVNPILRASNGTEKKLTDYY